MSDKPISVGDLVVVVRDCCGMRPGLIFTVNSFFQAKGRKCMYCGEKVMGTLVDGVEDQENYGGEISWLKRIPPLSELEGEQRREEIEA